MFFLIEFAELLITSIFVTFCFSGAPVKTDVLHKVQVPVTSLDKCILQYEEYGGGVTSTNIWYSIISSGLLELIASLRSSLHTARAFPKAARILARVIRAGTTRSASRIPIL
jgi:hypothetical protein